MYNMAKGFHKHGCDLTLLCFNTSKHYISEDNLPESFKNFGQLVTYDIQTDIRKRDAFRNLFTDESFHISRFDHDGFREFLRGFLAGKDFDVVQFDGLQTSVYVDVFRECLPEAKLVLRQHNVEHMIWSRMADHSSYPKKSYLNLLAKRLKAYELEVLQRFDAIVPITDVDAEFFKACGCEEMFTSPTGVDMDLFQPDFQKEEEGSVFHLGSLNWMPNQQGVKWFLEEIWPEIRSRNPELKFYIAGIDVPEDIQSWDGKENIYVLGKVPDAVEFMNSKAVMVVPLKSGSGMRIKVIEGMALGKAIVSTSIGAEGIDVKKGEDLKIADTKEAFVDEVLSLAGSKSDRQKVGASAIQLVSQKYSNYSRIGELLEYYKALKVKG